MQGRGREHDGKDRPYRVSERAHADGRHREARDQPLGAGGVDEGAARHLPHQADDAADRQHETDVDLGPFLRGEIDRDERTEAGLHVGDERR